MALGHDRTASRWWSPAVWDDTVRLWEARTGEARGDPLEGHKAGVMAVAWGTIDGEPVVVSGGWDGTVRLWNARTRRPEQTIKVGSAVYQCRMENGSAIALVTSRGILILDVGKT